VQRRTPDPKKARYTVMVFAESVKLRNSFDKPMCDELTERICVQAVAGTSFDGRLGDGAYIDVEFTLSSTTATWRRLLTTWQAPGRPFTPHAFAPDPSTTINSSPDVMISVA
jgi:hypothetical protein